MHNTTVSSLSIQNFNQRYQAKIQEIREATEPVLAGGNLKAFAAKFGFVPRAVYRKFLRQSRGH